jgi:class 3 adenylate cyclase
MITAEGPDEKLSSLDAGADDFILKPFDRSELLARVRSLLRIKRYHDTVEAQAAELAAQAAELAEWNATLERRVDDQVAELEALNRLRRFLAAPVADLVVNSGDERLLEAHRRHIAVLFGDLRGFTAFSETAEPEELIGVLREFHEAVGGVLRHFEATVGYFAGDSIMAYFNDPLPCPDPEARAAETAVAIRAAMETPIARWHKYGHDLGLGIGIAAGYATLGMVGFEGRFEYTALGTVVNLAARLCAEARAGQILISQRVYAAAEDVLDVEPIGELTLKGISRPTAVHNVVGIRGRPE